MRSYIIPSSVKKLLSLSFCENNNILPVSINGKKLTLLCADQNTQACKSTVVMLKDKYDVNVLMSTPEEIRNIITDNFYARCAGCGVRIDKDERFCSICYASRSAGDFPSRNYTSVPFSNHYEEDVSSLDGQIILQAPGNTGTGGLETVLADTNYVGKLCPYCQTAIELGDKIIICPDCGIPHHRECWSESGGCTTYGCRQSPAAIGAAGDFQPIDMSPDYMPGREIPPVNGSYLRYTPIRKSKSRVAALLLAIFLGIFGIHKFYLGDLGWGISYLIAVVFSPFFYLIPFGIVAVLVFYDIIVLAVMSDNEFKLKYG